MFYLLFFKASLLYLTTAQLTQDNAFFLLKSRGYGHSATGNAMSNLHNNSYPDKMDNLMPLPGSEFNEVIQPKKHPMKKSPKRTIQKIIKKNRKNKKFFFNHVTSQPTQASAYNKDLIDDVFVPDEINQRDDSYQPTTQANQKKKARRWNSKVSRYPMPFHKLQSRHDGSNFKRTRRETERDNPYILQDFDELQIVKQKKDYDTVRVHSRKDW